MAEGVSLAVEGLARANYRLWRYVGDDPGQRRGSGLSLPVLFIPGNGGSHEMSRSLASETIRRVSRLGLRAVDPVSVDWYLLDLEGEWSAFDGNVLEAQVEFALAAMRHLAALHNVTTHSGAPGRQRRLQHPGLVVVGHSMGGVVASDALARAAEDPELGPSVAALLVTLGSPHVRPPLPGHPALQAFYERTAARPRPVVPVVSIAGGAADWQVTTALTDPAGLAPQGLWRWLSLSEMPGGWCPSRHNGLVWCNQLVASLGQALVELAQDALPSLHAARKAAAAMDVAAASQRHGRREPTHAAAAWAAAQGLDPAQLVNIDDATGPADAAAASGGGGGGGLPSWDWALRRVDQHLAQPAQPYLAAALALAAAAPPPPRWLLRPRADPAEGTGVGDGEVVRGGTAADREAGADGEGASLDDGEVEDGLRQTMSLAERALTPAVDGGAGCSGANLAWYLQYNRPQKIKPRDDARAPLRLQSSDLGDMPSTGRMVSWELGAKRPAGRSWQEAGPRGWAAVISGSDPCSAFRAWLTVKVEYPAAAAAAAAAGGSATAASSGGGDGDGDDGRQRLEAEARSALAAPASTVRHDVEVTGLAAPLPAVTAEGAWPIRRRSDWSEIHEGRNYQSRAGWLLLFPPSLVLPLLRRNGGPSVLASFGGGEEEAGGGGGGAGDAAERPTVTLLLTLWLAEPSYKPAFRVIAQTLAPAETGSGLVRVSPMRLLPDVSIEEWKRAMEQLPQQHVVWPPPLHRPAQLRRPLVPLEVPYLSFKWPDGPGLVAAIVRWSGLYKYAAVRITRLGADGWPVSEGRPGAAEAGGAGGGCLYPTLLLVGGRRAGAPVETKLLQASTNRTFHSLAPCTTDPWGCAAVAAILDPVCDYRLDLVPYAAERLPALLLAHVGRLWLGAQLLALLSVVAATTAAATKATPYAAAVKPAPGEGIPRASRRDRRWPMLPWGALGGLQAALRWPGVPLLLLMTAAAANLAALLASLGSSPAPVDLPDAGSAAVTHNATMAPPSAGQLSVNGVWSLPALLRLQVAVRRQVAAAAGLCPRPLQQDCGWGPSSLTPLATQVLRLPLPLRTPGALQGSPGPDADALSPLDWSALAAMALLLAWLLGFVVQVVAAAAAVVQAAFTVCWWLLVRMPCSVASSPWLMVRRLVSGRRSRAAVHPHSQEATVQQLVSAARRTVLRRWVAYMVPLAALAALAGAPSAIPGLALLVSIVVLATSLAARPAKLPAAAEPWASVSVPWVALERRRCLAWLLYYTAYGICAAPAAAAALRRLAQRPALLKELGAALAALVQWLMLRLQEGRAVEMLEWGLTSGRAAAAAAAAEVLPRLLQPAALAAEALHALQWCWAKLQTGRGFDTPAPPGLLHGADPVAPAASTSLWFPVVFGAVGYLMAAGHCGALAWSAAAGPVGGEPWWLREPSRLHRAVTKVPLVGACWLLALAWWLGAVDAAHLATVAVVAAQLLQR